MFHEKESDMRSLMMFSLLFFVGFSLLSQTVSADDLDDLKATTQRYANAWNTRDLDTILEIEDAPGFGYSTAFPRPLIDKEQLRKAYARYFEMMELLRVTTYKDEYRVIGNTGLVWGLYSQTTKQKNGPLRTVYLRHASTYVKSEGKWKLVLYHRSLIPSEDIP